MVDYDEFVEKIVKTIVTYPEDVEVNQINSERTIILELEVNDEDIGKVIGKKGRTAGSIRRLLTAISAKRGTRRVLLEIIE